MTTRVTSKYQTTIPHEVRSFLKLSVDDPIHWSIRGNRVTILPAEKPLLKYKGKFKVGAGSIRKDIKQARKARALRVV